MLYVESNRMFQNKIVGTTQLDVDNFVPLARLITEYLVWAVRADAPQRSARDILDQVKADPDIGNLRRRLHAQQRLLSTCLRPAMQHGVDYKKLRVAAFRGNLNIQLLGGHVQVISTTASEALEHAKAGKMRLIATSAPSPQGGDLKGVPHWRGMGIDMQILHWRGLFAPAGTPPEVVAFWDQRLGLLMKTRSVEKGAWSIRMGRCLCGFSTVPARARRGARCGGQAVAGTRIRKITSGAKRFRCLT